MEKKQYIRSGLIFKGLAMGMAEIIPGVSGGTIAFITGIYEELIETIKGINFSLLSVLRKEGLGAFWKKLNGNFLLFLIVGMLVGIIIGIYLIGYLLENYPAPLWAFFFGLIIASAIYIGRKIKKWTLIQALILIVGAGIAYVITVLAPSEGSTNYLIVFFSGMIAISALILPGISGSFILLLLGMYTIIRAEAENVMNSFSMSSILIIIVFLLGCAVGLVIFSRVLSFTFKKYHDQTLAILTGFMIGSLNKIWPWRNPVNWLDKDSGIIQNDPSLMSTELLLSDHIQLIKEQNVLPSEYLHFDAQTGMCIVSTVFGFAIVFIFERITSSEGSS